MKWYAVYLFDFDYTLADSSRGIVMCFRNVLRRHGFTAVTDSQIKRTIGKTLEASFSVLTGESEPGTLAALKREYVKEADVHMTANTHLFPDAKEALLALKEKGAKVGIISTKYRYRIMDKMDQEFPENFFDVVIGGEDVAAAKPSPEGIRMALERLNAKESDVLYVGDSTVDGEAAQNAAVDFVGVTHGVTSFGELAAYPHVAIVGDLRELVEC